jgi:methyl-accepting chemotaxis protein
MRHYNVSQENEMNRTWTFGRQITICFATMVALTAVLGGVALYGLHSAVSSKDRVIDVDSQVVLFSQELLTARAERAAAFRGYLITGEQTFVDQMNQQSAVFDQVLGRIRLLVHTGRGRELVEQIRVRNVQYLAQQDKIFKVRRSGAGSDQVNRAFETLIPQRAALIAATTSLSSYEGKLADRGREQANAAAERDTEVILAVLIVSVLIAAGLAWTISRRLRRQIGSTVGEVQSSSAELQTTANQQAVGAREQATAMNEVSTTITELLATSQQIAESAQRVAGVAEQTATAGLSGRSAVAAAQASMAEIRHQVDAIVNHMLELGDKSQRIGSVLEIVSELAEQTNILAINSTIEAAGAGESGRRFSVVADEIRKLADRVAESTKEIRDLIDVVRGAVNTTVMATEIGSKAVEAGSAQVEGLASAFEDIVVLVTTTTDAAREIELSTKQQTTAVEQVNVAVANVAQTTRETEAGSGQTLQTASQLNQLSTKLQALVDAVPAGSR